MSSRSPVTGPSASPPSQPTGGGGALIAAYVALAVLAALLAVWGSFLVPLRLPGGIEGVAIVVAIVGNLAVGLLGATGTGGRLGAVVPGVVWIAVVGLLGVRRPEGDLVVPGRLTTDPGVGTVGTFFLLAGMVAAAVAVGIGPLRRRPRFITASRVPTPPV